MVEIFKAKDTRLDRFVAVNVLPEHLTEYPDALAIHTGARPIKPGSLMYE